MSITPLTPIELLERGAAEVRAALPAAVAQYAKSAPIIPGGSSRARFWWPLPMYVSSASGAYLTDIDGNRYIDCNMGFGSMVAGHAHPAIERALAEQLPKGVFFGAANELEEQWARRLHDNLAGAERVMFTNSGTEATLAALRIARVATGRDHVAKFEGGWHGPQEYLQHSYTTIGGAVERPETIAEVPGIPRVVSDTVLALPFNSDHALDLLREHADELACVVIEPIQGGGGAMPAEPDFLAALRVLCDETGVLLVFDEVITGFRVGPRSGSGLYGITPDLTTLGKAIGGGLPAGAVCGRGDLIDVTLPGLPGDTSGRRPVNLAGTHAGNAMSAAAGIAHIDVLLGDPDTYPRLQRLGDRMRAGLVDVLTDLGVEGYVTGVGSMWGLHFSKRHPLSVRDKLHDNHIAGRLLAAYLLLEGVLMSSPVHLAFLSTAHTDDDVDTVIAAHRVALARMQEVGCI